MDGVVAARLVATSTAAGLLTASVRAPRALGYVRAVEAVAIPCVWWGRLAQPPVRATTQLERAVVCARAAK